MNEIFKRGGGTYVNMVMSDRRVPTCCPDSSVQSLVSTIFFGFQLKVNVGGLFWKEGRNLDKEDGSSDKHNRTNTQRQGVGWMGGTDW